jgi:hypothetical protein
MRKYRLFRIKRPGTLRKLICSTTYPPRERKWEGRERERESVWKEAFLRFLVAKEEEIYTLMKYNSKSHLERESEREEREREREWKEAFLRFLVAKEEEIYTLMKYNSKSLTSNFLFVKLL